MTGVVNNSSPASGVITITTDFGHKGPFVATMKGVILTRFPDAKIVDVTHESLVYWPAEAGFWLSRAYKYFPAGTVHLAVIDPGVGTSRDIIIVTRDTHMFIAPDNGLLALLVERPGQAQIHRLDSDGLEKFALPTRSATFHGRDIFAPLGAELAAGNISPADLGPATDDIVPGWVEEPHMDDQGIHGVVITEDHFGNLITNIDRELVAKVDVPVAQVGSHEVPFHDTYGDVSPGEYVALINSFGVVEIARAERSAAEGLGLGRGAPVIVRRRS